MNSALQEMLGRYHTHDTISRERALREVIQEIALVGLWRSKFFNHAAFYGGTALRILHGLDRFSEDLDFTLLTPNPHFSWAPFQQSLVEELSSYGFSVSFSEKNKIQKNSINSAFLKANAYQEMLRIGLTHGDLKGIHPDTQLRIKLEIDTEPSMKYEVEQRFLEIPLYASLNVVTLKHLFAAKLHCAFFRAWKQRVKGRDWYDVIWFIRKKVPLSLPLLSQHMQMNNTMTYKEFQGLTQERIANLAIDKALVDVKPFVQDQAILSDWSPKFFHHWFQQIIVTDSC